LPLPIVREFRTCRENCQARPKIAQSALECHQAAQECRKWYRGLYPLHLLRGVSITNNIRKVFKRDLLYNIQDRSRIYPEGKMKKLLRVFLFVLLVFFFIGGTFAQPVKGKRFELSTSASMWNVKYEGEETETVFNLPLRIGFFITKGLEIEHYLHCI